jgi:RNA polymerase I-specific transcription initiation factor RRN7
VVSQSLPPDQEPESEPESEESIETLENGPGDEIADLLEGISDSDSDDQEGEPGPGTRPSLTSINPKGKKSHAENIGPPHTIAVLVIACFILRIPTTYMDFIR